MSKGVRFAEFDFETSQTRVQVVLDLDGGTRRDISTGIALLDHMLDQLALHGKIDIGISAEGNIDADDHYAVEDIGIALGRTIRQALADGQQIVALGSSHAAADDALALVAIEVSGRGQLHFDAPFSRDKLGDLSTEAIREFFQALVLNARLTVHIRKLAGHNDHHLCEAIFKGFGLALFQATRTVDHRGGSSAKGKMD